jgi:hypothetical protein
MIGVVLHHAGAHQYLLNFIIGDVFIHHFLMSVNRDPYRIVRRLVAEPIDDGAPIP